MSIFALILLDHFTSDVIFEISRPSLIRQKSNLRKNTTNNFPIFLKLSELLIKEHWLVRFYPITISLHVLIDNQLFMILIFLFLAGAAPEETNQRSSSAHNRHSLTKGEYSSLRHQTISIKICNLFQWFISNNSTF